MVIRQVIVILLLFGLGLSINLWLNWPDSRVHIIFCDVGQGDAILITEGYSQVLIDAGPDEAVLECLSRYLPWWDRSIELVTVTHADADHITGFPAVFDHYQVKQVLLTPYGKDNEVFRAFWQAITREKEEQVIVRMPVIGSSSRIGQLTEVFVLFPRVDNSLANPFAEEVTETMLSAVLSQHDQTIKSHNDLSISLLLVVGQHKILLTGDLESEGEQALLETGLLPDVDILKAGHHGAKTSTGEALLTQVRPEIVVFSSGKNNRFGHPAPEVMQRVEGLKSKMYRTDQLGDVHFISDGRSLYLK